MSNPYSKLLRDGRLRRHQTNPEEIAGLFEIVERDLADAAIAHLSADRCFTIAYNAVLQSATAILYSAGYRTHGSGHHSTTFDVLAITLETEDKSRIGYFDSCRRKRNVADYSGVGQISESEADELFREAADFAAKARDWIKQNHSSLATW